MKERPMLMSAPMVRAILAGTKTQTRRLVKPQPSWVAEPSVPFKSGDADPENIILCPYGKPGDRLWVRETFYAFGRWVTQFNSKKGRDEWHFVDMTLESGKSYLYPASDSQPQPMGGKRHKGGVTPTWWKRPAIFMPAAASRITLEVTGVRVERLQDISEADARAEGARACDPVSGREVLFSVPGSSQGGSYRLHFQDIWTTINGPESWDANPWVWVIEFKRLEVSA